MSELEDRLLRIVELKVSGLDGKAIAERLGIEVQVVNMYEESTKKTIQTAIDKGIRGLDNISNYANLSPVVLDMFSRAYEVELEQEDRSYRMRRTQENNTTLIRKALEEGKYFKEIKRMVGLTSQRIRNKQAKIEMIKKAINDGAISITDIMRRTGLKSYVSRLAKNEGIQLPKYARLKDAESAESIRGALNSGCDSLEELCKISNFKNSECLRRCCKKYDIELPKDLIPYRQRPEIDELVDKGLTLEEIGREVGINRERVRQYIDFSGQYEQYRENREKVKEIQGRGKGIKKKIKEMISLLKYRAKQLVESESWPLQKAVECFNFRNQIYNNCTPFSKLYDLFKTYETARNNGERLSLRELGRKADIANTTTGRILESVGVEPFFGKKEQKIKKRREKMDATKRGLRTDFTCPDIAYFLGLPEHVPGIRYHNIKNHHKGKLIASFDNYRKERKVLTCRLVSQIYEAIDCGFTRGEIIELLDTNNKVIDYYLEHTKEIVHGIVKGLRILYNDKTITKPYVTKKMREKLEREDIK